MREDPLLKIGEFARIGQVSIATLRHYDQCDLLKPNMLDPASGYRYYSFEQLARLHRILALKEMDFPLRQIAQLLEEDLPLEQLRGMFILKQAQTQRMIDMEQSRLTRIAARLRQLEQEGKMPAYEILLKQVDPLLVASIRDRLPNAGEYRLLYKILSTYLDRHNVSYPQVDLLILHSRHEISEEGMSIDVEVAIPLPAALEGNGQVCVHTLPGALMACTVHSGDDFLLGRAYLALYQWIKDTGYQVIGPPRYVHLQRAEPIGAGQAVTEIQFPVEKQNR